MGDGGGWLGDEAGVRMYVSTLFFFPFLVLARTRYVLSNEMYNSSLVLEHTHSLSLSRFDMMIGSE